METSTLEVAVEGPNETALRELYADDPFVDDTWFGRMVEEAQEQDRLAAVWAERAEDEAAQLDETEAVDE